MYLKIKMLVLAKIVGSCQCLIGVKNKVAARRSHRAELMTTPWAGGRVATNLEGEISKDPYMSAQIYLIKSKGSNSLISQWSSEGAMDEFMGTSGVRGDTSTKSHSSRGG